MAFVNYNNKEITVKIVYYGPALSGKTTCLKYIYDSGEYRKKGKLITLDTDGDRTLFFDFLPIEIGKLGDYAIKIQLYTVPGQVAYNTTRKLVLQGSDGIVFVADSQVVMREKNTDSFQNLKDNLKANNIPLEETPLIFHYNKRDLKETLPTDLLNKDLNPENKAFFPTVGTTGENVLEGLHAIMKMVLIHLKNKLTIFQKDKTVMFSRDEITDPVSKDSKTQKKAVKQDDSQEEMELEERHSKSDTEKEEIFELDDVQLPLNSEPMKTQPFPIPKKVKEKEEEEEIFNLGDESRFEDGESLDVPEAVIADELAEDEKEKPEAVNKEKPGKVEPAPILESESDEIEEIGKEYEIAPENEVEVNVPNLPINIKIPADKDEIKLNINLQIVIKKK
ncbi:MAG: ADP-ribosylation factor-like protein [Candidatus Aminicenantes bacterium]|jgi:signal recognition particle receptor subunit beta